MKMSAEEIRENLSISVQMIGPERAATMLEKRGKQRNLSEGHVNMLKGDMDDGKYFFTGEPIIFNESDECIDGQHRLTAVVNSGVTLPFLVLKMKNKKMADVAVMVMNACKRRSDADFLTKRGDKNCHLVSAITRLVIDSLTGSLKSRGSKVYSTRVLEDTRVKFPDIYDAAHYVGGLTKALKFCTPSILGYLRWKTHRLHPSESDAFFDRLDSGTIPEKESAVSLLRDRLLMEKNDKLSNLTKQNELALLIKAWNLFLQRKRVKQLRYSPVLDEYPQIM